MDGHGSHPRPTIRHARWLKAAFAYLPVFAVAFALGALRVTLVAPQTGALAAVALELPLVLALSWAVAGRVLRRWPQAPRAAFGALAFALLMLLELRHRAGLR